MVRDIVSVIVTDLSAWICLELSTILTTQTHRMPMRRIFLVSSFYYLAGRSFPYWSVSTWHGPSQSSWEQVKWF